MAETTVQVPNFHIIIQQFPTFTSSKQAAKEKQISNQFS